MQPKLLDEDASQLKHPQKTPVYLPLVTTYLSQIQHSKL